MPLFFVGTKSRDNNEAEMSSTPELKGVAQNVNDSIRTNETSLTHLEEQIDALTDALVSVNCKLNVLSTFVVCLILPESRVLLDWGIFTVT